MYSSSPFRKIKDEFFPTIGTEKELILEDYLAFLNIKSSSNVTFCTFVNLTETFPNTFCSNRVTGCVFQSRTVFFRSKLLPLRIWNFWKYRPITVYASLFSAQPTECSNFWPRFLKHRRNAMFLVVEDNCKKFISNNFELMATQSTWSPLTVFSSQLRKVSPLSLRKSSLRSI